MYLYIQGIQTCLPKAEVSSKLVPFQINWSWNIQPEIFQANTNWLEKESTDKQNTSLCRVLKTKVTFVCKKQDRRRWKFPMVRYVPFASICNFILWQINFPRNFQRQLLLALSNSLKQLYSERVSLKDITIAQFTSCKQENICATLSHLKLENITVCLHF